MGLHSDRGDADAFEREIQAFLGVFPEFEEECPVVDAAELEGPDVPAVIAKYGSTGIRIVTEKGAFGIGVWLRFHEQANPSVRDAIISGYIEKVDGADALYQEMIRRMSRRGG